MGFGGFLRANTAVDVLIGPFLDKTDGDTTEEALTIEDEHVLLSKNGQALTAKTDANDATHDDLGYYNCPLDTTDTDTEGQLTICCHMSGALSVRVDFQVLAEAAWDSLNVAKDDGFMDVNIKTVGRTDTQETEANNLESACSNYSVTRGLTGTALPAAAADAAGGLMISDDGGWDADELYDAIVTDATGANIAIDIIALKAETVLIVEDTNELQGDWEDGGRLDLIQDIIAADTTTDIPALIAALENVSTAEVNAEVVDALATDTQAEMAQGDPPAAASIALMTNYLYREWRNKKVVTATEDNIYDDAGTTKLVKATLGMAASTFTKGEMGSGA